jgi:hypothetical protein
MEATVTTANSEEKTWEAAIAIMEQVMVKMMWFSSYQML